MYLLWYFRKMKLLSTAGQNWLLLGNETWYLWLPKLVWKSRQIRRNAGGSTCFADEELFPPSPWETWSSIPVDNAGGFPHFPCLPSSTVPAASCIELLPCSPKLPCLQMFQTNKCASLLIWRRDMWAFLPEFPVKSLMHCTGGCHIQVSCRAVEQLFVV